MFSSKEGRGIPLSNTNQLWGLAWGALVFYELAGADNSHKLLVVAGSLIMILGALAISTAVASEEESESTKLALQRECDRYNISYDETLLSMSGIEDEERGRMGKRWWDYAIVLVAFGIFVMLFRGTRVPPLHMDMRWMAALLVMLVATLAVAGGMLWKRTRFY